MEASALRKVSEPLRRAILPRFDLEHHIAPCSLYNRRSWSSSRHPLSDQHDPTVAGPSCRIWMSSSQTRRNWRLTSPVSNCVGYAPSSFLDARQSQPSTESYRVNIQTGLILRSTRRMEAQGQGSNSGASPSAIHL
jgi:hypothetical protein